LSDFMNKEVKWERKKLEKYKNNAISEEGDRKNVFGEEKGVVGRSWSANLW